MREISFHMNTICMFVWECVKTVKMYSFILKINLETAEYSQQTKHTKYVHDKYW